MYEFCKAGSQTLFIKNMYNSGKAFLNTTSKSQTVKDKFGCIKIYIFILIKTFLKQETLNVVTHDWRIDMH